ncbi:LPS export ABC transporter periplasmic protein LptC [Microvirga massiliensis]|uniref:LPS export ABC transporter periplasmic protein LptC n=1 Tax=Microvirga massiliensis TaxID=1033741 RepID=UPI00062B33B9|nr:LPS export ABC transporter periplasmic protein LptC [Microvirga massiliensis]
MVGVTGLLDARAGSVPAGRSRAFTSARRHSRLVRFLKVAIPAGALIGGIAVAAVAILDPFRSVGGLSIGPVSLSGTQITMESPRLTGFRDGTRPYEVTATVANQDVRQPNLVELKDLRARIVTDDRGSTARLEANTGLLDTEKEHLKLHDQVRLTTEAGERIELNSASVDFKAGTVVSSEPVTVTLGDGVIRANGLEVKDSGKIMHFQGRVRTVFDSEIGRPPEQSSEPNPEQSTAVAQ